MWLLAAQSASQAVKPYFDRVLQNAPRHWPTVQEVLNWCQSMTPLTGAVLVLLGIVFLLFGYYAYKWLITLNAVLLAAFIGAVVGEKCGSALVGALVLAITAGALTWPTMKYAVAILGAIYGTILGQSIWRTTGLDPHFGWAGGTIGAVFFGLLSFILFRGCIIIFTSLQGAAMVVFGLLGLLFKYPDVAPQLTQHLSLKPAILPLLVFVPTVIGLMFQQNKFPPATPAKK